jgi:hypothetical protein
MLTYNRLFQNELTKMIDMQIDTLKENLTTIHKMEGFDFATYKEMVGKIEGLRLALELCDEAERITNGQT